MRKGDKDDVPPNRGGAKGSETSAVNTWAEAGQGGLQFRPSPGHPLCSKQPGLQFQKGAWGQGSPSVQILERAARGKVGEKSRDTMEERGPRRSLLGS